jgi:hypothetical protein
MDELITMYELEPSIRDVYVEGASDRCVFEWFFKESGRPTVGVREIETVHVPAGALPQPGCENSNRGRVMALARVLQSGLGGGSRSVTCVIDADFDRALGRDHECELLLLTDYSCLEMYFFEPRALSKLVSLVLRGFPDTPGQILARLEAPLLDLAALRLANLTLQWNLRWVNFARCLVADACGPRLDINKYIRTYLSANARLAGKREFEEAFTRGRARLVGDARHYINGHDFVCLLTWYVRGRRGFGDLHPQVIERSLFACAELAALSGHSLFRSLIDRVS